MTWTLCLSIDRVLSETNFWPKLFSTNLGQTIQYIPTKINTPRRKAILFVDYLVPIRKGTKIHHTISMSVSCVYNLSFSWHLSNPMTLSPPPSLSPLKSLICIYVLLRNSAKAEFMLLNYSTTSISFMLRIIWSVAFKRGYISFLFGEKYTIIKSQYWINQSKFHSRKPINGNSPQRANLIS